MGEHQFVGWSGNNGAGGNHFSFLWLPDLPQSRQGKQLSTFEANVVRLLVLRMPLPLVKAVGDDRAASVPDGITKGWFFPQSFRSGID